MRYCLLLPSHLPHAFAVTLMLVAAAGCADDERSRHASDGGVSVRSDGGAGDAGDASGDGSIGPDGANDADGGGAEGGGAICGNGIREGDEACDGEDLGEASCEVLGYRVGTPACTSRCTIATTTCESPVYRRAATGDGFTCAIRESGAVDCWGSVTSPSGTFEHISAGYYPCGVTTDHALVCWGHGDELSLPTGRFTTVEVTNERACAIREDGTVACFGYTGALWAPSGSFVQVAVGAWGPHVGETGSTVYACGRHPTGALTCWEHETIVDAPLAADFVDITVGRELACAVHADHSLECWGHRHGNSGHLIDVAGAFEFASLTVEFGSQHRHNGLGIRADGTLGRFIGLSTNGEAIVPEPPAATRFVQLDHYMQQGTATGAPAYAHACGITGAGELVCFGNNDWGQTTIPNLGRYSALSANRYGCGVRAADGALECWGGKGAGHRESGVAPPPAGTFSDVAVGDGSADTEAACALGIDGSVVCWGDGIEEAAPEAVFTQVSVGHRHACGIVESGTASCWGFNVEGSADAPRDVRFTEVRAAQFHTCGLTTDGTIRCWGRDSRSLDDARYTKLSTHAGPSSPHTCALRDDGATVCWGTAEPAIVDAGPAIDVARFADGVCVLRPDGRVDCLDDAPEPPATMTFESLTDEGGLPCGLRPGGAIYCWGARHWGAAD